MSIEGLPGHWAEASLGDIVHKLVDGSHNPPPKQSFGFPMLSAVNINRNKIDFTENYRLIDGPSFAEEDRRTAVVPGDILLTIVGAIGRAAVVPAHIDKFTLQRSVAVIGPALVDSKFLCYQFEASQFARYLTDNARGTAQKGVYLKTLASAKVRLAPLLEQRRIVAKIEELLSELDKGVEALTTAWEQLKAYRQSVLKHAFEGKLTEAWRARHKETLTKKLHMMSNLGPKQPPKPICTSRDRYRWYGHMSELIRCVRSSGVVHLVPQVTQNTMRVQSLS